MDTFMCIMRDVVPLDMIFLKFYFLPVNTKRRIQRVGAMGAKTPWTNEIY